MMPFLLVDNAHLAVVIAITAVGDIGISRVIGTGALVHSFGSMNLSLQFNVPVIQFDDYGTCSCYRISYKESIGYLNKVN